jgi:hypothetical protein
MEWSYIVYNNTSGWTNTSYCSLVTNLYSMLLYWTIGNCNTLVSIIILYYNLIGALSCMRSVVDRNVVMRCTPVRICWNVTWVDTRTLNKMAAYWGGIKTLHSLQKMRSGSGQKFSQLWALTWLVLMSQWGIFPHQLRNKRLLMTCMQREGEASATINTLTVDERGEQITADHTNERYSRKVR